MSNLIRKTEKKENKIKEKADTLFSKKGDPCLDKFRILGHTVCDKAGFGDCGQAMAPQSHVFFVFFVFFI